MRSRLYVGLVVILVALACGGAEPPVAPTATPVDSVLVMPMGPGTMGRWVRTGYPVTGTVTVYVENGVARLDLSADFSVSNVPGPVLYLNTTNNPNGGQPLRIGPLKSRTGASSYTFAIPSGVRYTWAIIWCDPFNVPIAEAAIPPTP